MHAGLGTIMCKFASVQAICLREEAIFVKSQKCPHDVTFDVDLDLEHILDAGSWGPSCASSVAIQPFAEEEAISVKSEKCPWHVTFDLDLDLEHTLDAGLCGDHRVQVWWRSSHVCGRCSDVRKSLQTDRQTDGRRTPHDCISSCYCFVRAASIDGLMPFLVAGFFAKQISSSSYCCCCCYYTTTKILILCLY